MDVGDIRLYRERWQAVEEIERQELRAMTASEHWQKSERHRSICAGIRDGN